VSAALDEERTRRQSSADPPAIFLRGYRKAEAADPEGRKSKARGAENRPRASRGESTSVAHDGRRDAEERLTQSVAKDLLGEALVHLAMPRDSNEDARARVPVDGVVAALAHQDGTCFAKMTKQFSSCHLRQVFEIHLYVD